ncbi:transposase [Candidatus Roizmanbacteria bacterium RIFCSPHIGHO2_01_FULL_39_12c]|uniref:Transposase n=1 Tax=Candidatus Roizmanbacteria bacterium RIFCSPHIGHO2_01_FULL_39_12c TaxID=1802031 RepID=A0A1F7GCF2_9BACT|nr:MAG: transposase [Candidatus Roizmanbacteria bacterium RIFCSPHIGHO2_01_FULL_39_12c]
MSKYIRKSHNVSLILYHFVCPAKYRRVIFDKTVDLELKNVCLEISKRFEIIFLEIGTDKDHVHFLIQSVPIFSPKRIIRIVKSITSREIFSRLPHVKKTLWGGEFWSDGYFVSTVGRANSEQTIIKYIKEQGREAEYIQLHRQQLQFAF